MGVHSYSGPIGEEELQTVMLGGEMEMCGELGSSSTFAVKMLNWGVSLVRHSVCEEYKHSA